MVASWDHIAFNPMGGCVCRVFFFSSRRRHTRFKCDWSSDVCSSDLAIDIGGTGIKAALLDDAGSMIGERQRVPTPSKPVAPEDLVRAIDQVAAPLGTFDRVSVGFPGYVRDGRVITAPNLGTDALAGFDLQSVLVEHLGKPVRVLNDAEVQGLGAIQGRGLEMVLTLGTGAGTALFRDGEIMPHLELAHHPVSGNKTYDEYIGNAARKKKGR